MGETGCGKTRLIRYMCDLARQGKDAINMLIMKVSFDFPLQYSFMVTIIIGSWWKN